MSMFKKLAKAGIAAKVVNEARKPHNQAKIKRFLADVNAKRKARARAH